MNYENIKISKKEAKEIALQLFGIKGSVSTLPGEIDFNFLIEAEQNKYILKISRPDVDINYIIFQDELLQHIENQNPDFEYPQSIRNAIGSGITDYEDKNGFNRKVRLLNWIDGILYSQFYPKSELLRFSLGKIGGQISKALLNFNHDLSKRTFDWDLAHALWVKDYLNLFDESEKEIITFFVDKFVSVQPVYENLRKSTIHNDANDNNIIVENNTGEIKAIIDFGDAVYSQIINDLSVTLAYACMDFEDPLLASISIIKGYNESFPLYDEELKVLYITTAMRLVISVTKSAINKKKEPENEYLQISEKPAWDLLRKWKALNQDFAYYTFRYACGLEPCTFLPLFQNYIKNNSWSLSDLIPIAKDLPLVPLDLSVSSKFIGNFSAYTNNESLIQKISKTYTDTKSILLGGYGEARPIYTSDAFQVKTNEGYEHRTIHLGVDFWQTEGSIVQAIDDGVIFSAFDNNEFKDYGPTIIIKHDKGGFSFFTLYGHLSRKSIENKYPGQAVKKGEKIAEIGTAEENGNWAPHLHFQVILDMLGHKNNFFGVSSPTYWPVFKSICPDPNLFFKTIELNHEPIASINQQIDFRKQHLGKSLSLSYEKPLKIVRGQMQYLINEEGQKYLDTVNNVAHVGHEHPKVVEAGCRQMGVLNTNTRYLNDEILAYTTELLATFPSTLGVVHFVNSGSEANELALRMARAYTKQKDVIALEIGYHGNTQACIDISSYKFDGKGGSGCPSHTHIVPLPDAFRGKYHGEDSGLKYAKHVKDLIEKIKSKGRNVSAFMAESIVSCGGQIELPQDFLGESYKFIRSEGGLCIADEVQTGFGRVGKHFWGFQLYGVVPDIVTMGKPIGNGHPMAAVVCTREVADAFANGMEYFNTFGGNPVSCSIGRQVLNIIEEENLQKNAREVGEFLKFGLTDLSKIFPILADVRGQGLFLGIELCDKNRNPLPEQANYLVNRMKDYKILMSLDGPQHNVLKIKPPICFSFADAAYLLETMDHVLKENFLQID